jgi:gluconokinase
MASGRSCTRTAVYGTTHACSACNGTFFSTLFLPVELTLVLKFYIWTGMEYFIGVDIGTTSVKTIAFSSSGKVLYKQTISYPILHPFPDWSEQNPEQIAEAVFNTVENMLQLTSPFLPKSIGFSSAMHSLIAVDTRGQALSPCLIWADNRAAFVAEKIHNQNIAKKIYHLTGVPVHAMSPFCKLLWMREHQPELYKTAHKFIGIKEFIFYKLFGVFNIDLSIAAATGLMNEAEKKWDPWILEQLDLSPEKLSSINATEQIYYEPAIFPSLKNVAFVIGGSDGAMANFGASDEKGILVITVGTSSAARIVTSKPHFDPLMRTFCYRQGEQKWLVGGASNNGAVILQWLHEKYFSTTEPFEVFLNTAKNVTPGAGGLIFLPYLLGERAPIWNAAAKGVLFGMTINHNREHMIRASMEAVIYCLYSISQPLFEKTSIDKIYATGGFARNELWLQMLADIFNMPVMVSETIENSAWGAAKTAMYALGLKNYSSQEINNKFMPVHDVHLVYAALFKKFQHLYTILKEEFV